MDTTFGVVTWNEAVRSFLVHLKAVRAPKTVAFYKARLTPLLAWAERSAMPIDRFGKRQLDEYLVSRAEAGISQTTLHHDALAAKVLLKWCQRNDIIERSPLSDYEVRSAPRPAKYMPTSEDMERLLEALHDFWNPAKNGRAHFITASRRFFHSERNYAIVLTLLDSACRIGEVLSLKVDDYQASARQFTVRQSKGREPRVIPVSPDGAAALADWLKVRLRVMRNVPPAEDEGWLFISESGTKIDEGRFLKTLRKITRYAELSENITLHSLRRFSLNRLAKHNLLAAQAIAGHKDAKTTLIYTRIDPDFVRDMHEQVGVVRGILGSRRADRKRRLV